jgi:ubiquinone biosynthesis protein
MLRTLRHSQRLAAIALVLAWEFKPIGKRRRGQRLACVLERLGPAFIKLGQALSTRSDLIGDEVADDLSGLRDKLPPFPTAIARSIVEQELQAPIDSLFSEFDDKPAAAASIAQVHRAVTKDGKTVAVKVLRPNIEGAFARDIDLFFWIAGHMQGKRRWRRLKPLEVVKTLKDSVFLELDLRFEAAAADELRANVMRRNHGFRVPATYWNLTGKRVLTTEWIDGIRLNDVAAIRQSGFDPDMVLTKAAQSLFSQVFEDGFFHADLHPGNLFVGKDGDLVAVDFGIMGRLDWESRLYIAEILRGFMTEDYKHVAQVHFDAGYVPASKSLEAFTQACMAVARPIIGKPLSEISIAKLLGQMFKIAAEFEMETQPQLLLLQKTMMVTEGVGRMLNPNLNMWILAKPLMEDWAQAHFGALGKIKDTAKQGFDAARKLPFMLGYVENALKRFGDPEGVKLHRLSIEEIQAGRASMHKPWLALGWTALAIAILFGFSWLCR